MRKIMSWMLAAIFICGASVLNSCKDAHAQEDNPAPQVVSTELIRTSRTAWSCPTTSRDGPSWWQ